MIYKSGEDYLETIYNLTQDSQQVRSVDVAKALNVSKPSTCKALQHLQDNGYIEKEHYGTIALTKTGRAVAEMVLKKHKAIMSLLIDVLKVSPEAAEIDACKIEHCISEETTKKLFEFLKLDSD